MNKGTRVDHKPSLEPDPDAILNGRIFLYRYALLDQFQDSWLFLGKWLKV